MAASLRPHPPRYTVIPAQGSHGQLRLVPSNGEQPQPDFHQGNAVEPRGQLQLASGRYNSYPVFNSRQNYIRAGMRGAITRSTQQSLSIHSTAGRGTARRTSGRTTVGCKFNRTVVNCCHLPEVKSCFKKSFQICSLYYIRWTSRAAY